VCYNIVTMKLGRFSFQLKREPRPLPAETVTLLSQLVDTRLSLMEANVKETRQRLETIYRKVYRDAVKDDGDLPGTPPILHPPRILKAGDPYE